MTNNTLVVGASGGIGRALVRKFSERGDTVFTVDRKRGHSEKHTEDADNIHSYHIASHSDTEISALVAYFKDVGININNVVIALGMLHNQDADIHPEKRMEEVSEQSLSVYFTVNSIIPMLWLKHLINIIDRKQATIVCLSARVGSISDNGLGGWYGYRASKAALNMLVKTASVEYRRRVKDSVLVCYHPGTVDTALSKPFQKNVAAEKLFTADFTASQLITHLPKLDREQACHFIDWRGEVVTW